MCLGAAFIDANDMAAFSAAAKPPLTTAPYTALVKLQQLIGLFEVAAFPLNCRLLQHFTQPW